MLPLGSLSDDDSETAAAAGTSSEYEFQPSAESILEEVVPTSFKAKLFKCFLDAAVSEQVARMIAMKGATESAGDMIKQLSMTYNRARQSQITGRNHGNHRRSGSLGRLDLEKDSTSFQRSAWERKRPSIT